MKITIQDGEVSCTVEVQKDNTNMEDTINWLIIPCLLGLGYQRETIDEYIKV